MKARNILYSALLLGITSFTHAQNTLNTDKLFRDGSVCYQKSIFKEALNIAEKAVSLYQKGNTSSLEHANWLNNKALSLIGTSDYKQAVSCFREALQIYAKIVTESNKAFLTSAESMINQIEYINNSTEVYLKDHPEQKEEIAKGNLASLNMITSAIISCEENAIGKKLPTYTTGGENVNLAEEKTTQNNPNEKKIEEINKLNYQQKLAQDKGDYSLAIDLCKQIQAKLKLLSDSYFKENLHISKKHNLAIIDIDIIANCIMSGQQKDIASQIERCANTLDKENNVSGFYAQTPLYEAVIKAYEHNKDIDNIIKYKEILAEGYKQHYGDITEYGDLLNDIALLYNKKDKACPKAGIAMSEAIRVARNIVTSAFPLLTEMERDTYWEQFKPWIANAIFFASQAPNDELLTQTAYNAALLSKGILLSVATDMGKTIANSDDKELIATFEKLKEVRKQLKTAMQDKKNNGEKIGKLTKESEHLERILGTRTLLYGNYTAHLKSQWEDVAKHLSNNAIAIEFAVTNIGNNKQQLAFILRKGWQAPKLVSLGPIKELAELTKAGASSYLSMDVTNRVWEKIISLANIKDKETIYFSPDGFVNQYGIEYLPTADGNTMSARYRMVRLSSTKEICFTDAFVPSKKAQLYGDILFSSDKQALVTKEVTRSMDIDSFLQRTGDKPQGGLHELPATAQEVNAIDDLLESQKYSVSKETGANATEASFKELTGRHLYILHIATHGFYWTERNAKHMKMAFLNKNGSAEERALSRSGLFVAGANYVLGGANIPKGLEDGVLTSREIADINLSNVSMAVLSACQTGLGEDGADGVFGLQRGFKKAGVHTIVMSLWKVDDNATQILMTEFYKNIAKGVDRHLALTLAQENLRNVDNGKYKDPYYWAAFIMLD